MLDIFYFDKKVKKAKVKELEKIKKKQIWIDVTDITKEELELLTTTFRLHHLTAEDLYNNLTRIKIEEFPEYIFCVFFAAANMEKVGLQEVDIILGRNFIITNHRAMAESINGIKEDQSRLEELFKKGNDFLFHKVMDTLIDSYFPILEVIDDSLVIVEAEATNNPKHEVLSEILKLKELIYMIKKTALQQREKLSRLTKADLKFITKSSIPYFRDLYDHSIIVSDSIDNDRESVSVIMEIYMSAISNNLNEVMKVLGIIATITIPLMVIPSIYGTNFRLLPGANHPLGFALMLLSMLLFCIGMLVFFKKKRWF